MDILMVAPELAPYARASRAGDTVAALGKALCQLEHRVTLAVPRYPGFEAGGLLAARRLTPLRLDSGANVTLLDGQLPTGATVVLFDAPGLFDRPGIYGEGADYPDNAQRFGLLSSAAVALARQRAERGQPFDVVHLHDWPCAPAALALRTGPSPVATVLSLHDGRRRGLVPKEALSAFGLSAGDVAAWSLEAASVSLAALGVQGAHAVTAMSPTIASDWLDGARFGALARALAASGTPVTGILSGLDYAVFNPATDPAIRSRYDAEAPANKGNSKTELCRRVGIEVRPSRPLLVAIVEPADDGAEFVEQSLDALLGNDVALVVVVRDAPEVAERLGRLRAGREEIFAVDTATDDAALRRACAAADLVILPSPYETTSTWARAAQRYGALPVAHAAGAHVDAIVDCDAGLDTGTGFLFEAATPDALAGAVARGLSAYAGPRWGALQRRVMRLDLSWDRTARRYVQVYRQAVLAHQRAAQGAEPAPPTV